MAKQYAQFKVLILTTCFKNMGESTLNEIKKANVNILMPFFGM